MASAKACRDPTQPSHLPLPSIQGRAYPPLTHHTALAQLAVRDLELPTPPHFCQNSLLIFKSSHHGTFRKFQAIVVCALRPC